MGESEAVARRWFEEVWNQRRAETVRELLTAESLCRAEGGVLVGPDAFLERQHAPFLAAFPDLRVEVEGTVAEGEQVVVRWRAAGTHAPTGRRVAFRGMTWMRVEGGRLVEGQDCWNQAGLERALAGGPAPPSVELT